MELTRLVFGLLVAVLLPTSLDVLRTRPWAAHAITGSYAAYAVFPVLDGAEAALVWAAAVLTGMLLLPTSGRLTLRFPIRRWTRKLHDRSVLSSYLRPVTAHRSLAMVSGVLLLAVGVFYGSAWPQKVVALWRDDKLGLVLSGFLLAVFVGNLVVARVVRPYFNVLPEQGGGASLLHLGTQLGWIERALVFTFIATGQPAAAALAIAVKSLVRLPEVREQAEGTFSQYVMVGTMTSLIVAVGAGIAVRIALGLPAL
ncbi:hypothetical protein [Micromonospora sp.]|uniref:hypothetical protein n=1 Tax=Micromonospora sp. TaxID=1876 RepID=UPI003B3BE333